LILTIFKFRLIGTIVIYLQNYGAMECNKGEYMNAFLIGSMGILNLMIVADLLLIYNSMKGGIMDTEARRFVPFCLYIK